MVRCARIDARIDCDRRYWYMKEKKKCDVVITSSSRPELLKMTIKYFKKFIHYQGKFRFLLHEDFIFPKESEKVVDWAREEFGEENVFFHDPPIELIESAAFLLKRVVTPYMIMLQDDWMFERPVELDRIIYLMDNYSHVNLVNFNKARNTIKSGKWEQPEEHFPKANCEMCLKPQNFAFTPSVWRSSFAIPHYLKAKDKMNKKITAPARMTSYLRSKNIDFGSYSWGRNKEPRLHRHIGDKMRAEKHHRASDGGWGDENQDHVKNAKRNMAQWLDYWDHGREI